MTEDNKELQNKLKTIQNKINKGVSLSGQANQALRDNSVEMIRILGTTYNVWPNENEVIESINDNCLDVLELLHKHKKIPQHIRDYVSNEKVDKWLEANGYSDFTPD